MAILTYFGHATFGIETDEGQHLVVDPFFDDNPACTTRARDVVADFILLTHGHYDHVADAVPIAERTGATVIASHEISEYMAKKGISVSAQHIGGGVHYPFGHVKMTPALHGGMLELPGGEAYTTVPAGFLVTLRGGQRVYFAGDTALLMEMELLRGRVDVAVLPIGDRYTMGPEDAVRAVDMIEPTTVVPCHFDTWPPIAQDPEAFRRAVGDRARVEVMKPGTTLEL